MFLSSFHGVESRIHTWHAEQYGIHLAESPNHSSQPHNRNPRFGLASRMNHLSGCSSGKSCKNVNLGEWIHQLLYIIFNHTQRQLLSTIWAEAMTKSAQFKRQCNFSDSFCDAFYEMCYWCYNPSILLVANPDLTLLTW